MNIALFANLHLTLTTHSVIINFKRFVRIMSELKHAIEFKTSALKAINKAPLDMQKRLMEAIWSLEEDPRPRGTRKLKHKPGLWRIRVGEYRVVYQIIENQLLVLIVAVGPRRDIYGKI